MTNSFRLSHDGPVTTLTLSKPEKRNAMTADFWRDLPREVDALSDSGTCRCLVIDAEGPHFSSGIDVGMLTSVRPDGLGASEGLFTYDMVSKLQRTFTALEKARMPVIAAIQGGCIGGGVDLVTACDIRLCTDNAYFTIFEVNMGLTADVGTFPRVLNHLPEGIVRELSYTGRKMHADEALRFGFVNRVLEDHESVRSAAQDLAQDIASKSPMAVYGTKEIITYSRDHSTTESLDRIALWNASNLQSTEVMAAMMAQQSGKPGAYTALPARKKDEEDEG
ncbi:MAG: enoyl-CoA hydratase-related protein [Pseudomonadota bacterium]